MGVIDTTFLKKPLFEVNKNILITELSEKTSVSSLSPHLIMNSLSDPRNEHDIGTLVCKGKEVEKKT